MRKNLIPEKGKYCTKVRLFIESENDIYMYFIFLNMNLNEKLN
jgi:hypothetical protein